MQKNAHAMEIMNKILDHATWINVHKIVVSNTYYSMLEKFFIFGKDLILDPMPVVDFDKRMCQRVKSYKHD